jgi:acetyl-CoA acetyltransferase
MTDIVITAAKRTAVGSFLGSFATVPAHELGRVAILAALADAGVAPDEVDEVILGNVLTAAQGMNPARQAAIHAGIPASATAVTINQVCGSGLRAVAGGAGDQGGRRDDHGRGRPGEHVALRPCPDAARGDQDGQCAAHRHDDP